MKNGTFDRIIRNIIDSLESWSATLAALEDDAISEGDIKRRDKLGNEYERVMAAKEFLEKGKYAKGIESYAEYLYDSDTLIAKEKVDELKHLASELGLKSAKLDALKALGEA